MTTDKWKNEKKIDNETNAFMQVRKSTGENTLHIQVYGTCDELKNREYGYADKFTVPPVVTDSLLEMEADLYPSLATEQQIYFRDIVELHAYVDGVQLLMKAPSAEWNTPDGFVLDLPAQRFSPFIAFVEAVGLLTNHEGEQRFVAPAQEEE